MAFKAYSYWMDKASGKHSIQHILSLDIDDETIPEYRELFTQSLIVVENDPNGYVVGATNCAAKYAKGRILIYLSDDFLCPDNWDAWVCEKLEGKTFTALDVDDQYQTNRNLFTIPIITRDFYDKWGYFWHPAFKSMFCDNFMFEQVKRDGTIIKCWDEPPFIHLHHTTSDTKEDSTYKRSGAQYREGMRVFNRLSKQKGWGLKYTM